MFDCAQNVGRVVDTNKTVLIWTLMLVDYESDREPMWAVIPPLHLVHHNQFAPYLSVFTLWLLLVILLSVIS